MWLLGTVCLCVAMAAARRDDDDGPSFADWHAFRGEMIGMMTKLSDRIESIAKRSHDNAARLSWIEQRLHDLNESLSFVTRDGQIVRWPALKLIVGTVVSSSTVVALVILWVLKIAGKL